MGTWTKVLPTLFEQLPGVNSAAAKPLRECTENYWTLTQCNLLVHPMM